MNEINIGFILGDWARNIGNSFFQLGGYYVLKKLFPKANFALIPEQPGYPSYWNPKGGNPVKYYSFNSYIDIDYLVLMGPIFRPEIFDIWGGTLKRITQDGTRIILLGVAAMEYEQEHLNIYREFLKQFPPFILTSRDTYTYSALGDLAQYSYNGIDFGFYVSEFYKPVGFKDSRPLLVLNFDKIPEPKISLFDGKQTSHVSEDQFSYSFKFDDMYWNVKFPKIRRKLAESSRYLMFLEGILFGNDTQGCLENKYKVVRTDHRPHPMIKWKSYKLDNILVNDVPYPYFEVYNQAKLTLTNRMHACVAALSYGQHSMLFSKSPRVQLLERLGLENIKREPMKLDLNVLEKEKNELERFLMDIIPI